MKSKFEIDIENGFKICNRCDLKKDLTEFYKKTPKSYLPFCKKCNYTKAKIKIKQYDINGELIKTCSKCNESKNFKDFPKTGLRCKICFNKAATARPNRKASASKYANKNKDKMLKYGKEKYWENIEETRKKQNEKMRRLRSENPEHYKKYSSEYNNKRYHRCKNNPSYKIPKILRSRFLRAVTQEYKNTSVIDLLGCEIEYFRNYIESKWLEGMSWDNHGNWERGEPMKWHIDHIKPCDSFDLTDPEQQKICFHYTNLQPLWAIDNLNKSNSIPHANLDENGKMNEVSLDSLPQILVLD